MDRSCLAEPTLRSAADLESCLREWRTPELAALGLPTEFVLPCYDISIANLPATAAAALGGEVEGGLPSLPANLCGDLIAGVRRVVWLIFDSVGWLHLSCLLEQEPELFLARLARDGRFLPITSVFPSTTTSALTTLWTGFAPAQHGLVGHTLYLREFGVVADMLMLSPSGAARREELVERGLDRETFLPVPGLGHSLAANGIVTRALINMELARTGFSHLSFRGVAQVTRFVTAADMAVLLRQTLEAHPEERLLVSGYLAEIDSIGHMHGPQSASWCAELRSVDRSLEHEFVRPLSPELRKGTLLMVTADHGQMTGQGSPILLADHPQLADDLLLPATGSARTAYIYVRQGRLEAVREYLERHLSDQFAVLDSRAALEAGLLGPVTSAAMPASRLGDLILMARDHFLFNHRRREHRPKGMHAGSSPEEMLTPLLMVRLD